MKEPDAGKTKNFECRRCGHCCEQAGFVYLNEAEAEKIAGFLRMDASDFVNEYCELFERSRLVLKKAPDERCVFLEGNACRVYSARPAQCRDFPLKWSTQRSFGYCAGVRLRF